MAWYDFFTGTPARTEQIPLYGQQQQKALNQILPMALAGLKPESFGSQFAPIAQQARTQFNQQTIPSIAERFTSMGGRGTGALSSPAFASQLGQAGAGLEGNLAAQQAQFGLNQQDAMMRLLGMALTPQFGTLQHPGQSGLFQQLAPLAGLGTAMYGAPMIGSGISALLNLLNGGSNSQSQQSPTSFMSPQSTTAVFASPEIQNLLRPF